MTSILIYPSLTLIVFNGLVSSYFGEVLAEGLAISSALALLMASVFASRLDLNYRLLMSLFPLAFVIAVAALEICFSGQFYRLLFLYQYILFFVLIIAASSNLVLEKVFVIRAARFFKARREHIIFMIGVLPVLAGQQLHASPTVFSSLVIAFFLVVVNSRISTLRVI